MSKVVIDPDTIAGLESLEISAATANAIKEADKVFAPIETKACLNCGEDQAADKSLLDKLYEGSGLKGVVDDLHEEEMDKFQTDKDFREGIEEGDQEKIDDAIRRGNEHRKEDSPFVDVVETAQDTATKIKENDYKGAIIAGATGAAETAAKRVPGGKQAVKRAEKVFDKKQGAKSIDPPGTKRNKNGQLYDEKTGQFANNPNTSKDKYRRSKSERKKALERDANDPNSDLTPEARDYIKKHKGNKVPDKKSNKDYEGDVDYAVHHKKPLYTKDTIESKKGIDKARNMETIPKQNHVDTHRPCGGTYHKHSRKK